MKCLRDGGQEYIARHLFLSFKCLFIPYHMPYYDGRVYGIKCNSGSGSSSIGELTMSLKSFQGPAGDHECPLLKIPLKYLFAQLSGI